MINICIKCIFLLSTILPASHYYQGVRSLWYITADEHTSGNQEESTLCQTIKIIALYPMSCVSVNKIFVLQLQEYLSNSMKFSRTR